MWLACASLMLALLVASSAWVRPEKVCPQPVLSPNVVLRQPGANVTLRCLERAGPNSTVVHWRFKGLNRHSNPAGQVGEGPTLFLPAVRLNHSGQYSCYANEHRLQVVRLVVEEPLETPNFTCFRRGMTKDILCEWKPSRPVSPHIKAHLLVAEGFMTKNHTEYQCRYYVGSQKFTCRIVRPKSDSILSLQVYMCVLHAAGQASHNHQFLHISSLLKPDPPVDVTVNIVEDAPQKLLVAWRNPPSWGSSFYYLKFQLRYRAENSPIYNQVEIKEGVTSYMIQDALARTNHIVQVRGCEEFDHGSWSEWSRKSIGTPWIDPYDPELETTSYVSKFPCDFCFEDTSYLPSNTAGPAVEDVAIVPLHTFLIMAFSVTVGFALVVGIILRYRSRWQPSGDGKQSKVPQLSLAPVSPSPPLSTSPLLTPPASPLSESSADSPRILDHNTYDVSNADYFLLPQ